MFRGLGRHDLRAILAGLLGCTLALFIVEATRPVAVPPRINPNRIEQLPAGRLTVERKAPPSALPAVQPETPQSLPPPTPVPTIAPTATPSMAIRLDGRIDLNRATVDDLLQLPGVGETRAAAIIADRDKLGPFPNVASLDRVPGFGEKTVNRLAPLLWVDSVPGAPATAADTADRSVPIRINIARAEELETLAGIGPVLARRIVDFRTTHGAFRGPSDLMKVPGLGPVLVGRNQGRVRYD